MNKFEQMMMRRNEIMKNSIGLNYEKYAKGTIAFDYEAMMNDVDYSLDEIREIQLSTGVGNTPLIELKNINKVIKKQSKEGYGARIFLKDESCNASGSFKDRRASISVYHAKKMGYKGVVAATSGNYGAAVASQAAKHGLKCIIIQECFDSKEKGQPEILEKARKCEAYGAEVIQTTVGPELFYTFLEVLDKTGYFNASLYSPYGIAGVETLGDELYQQAYALAGREVDAVVITHAGGGNLTGTARGLIKAGAKNTQVIAASVNLKGLHMASDHDFNLKSFTTGHTGFGIPFATVPDRSDVPRSAARALRYMDRYVTVTQGEVFYMTEMLAQMEGLERGPAGNTSLAAAFCIAQEMKANQIIVVQETEYTGAGKHIQPQLSFAVENGVELKFGNPVDEVPGKSIILPSDVSMMHIEDLSLEKLKKSYLNKTIKDGMTDTDYEYLASETRLSLEEVKKMIEDC